MLLEHFKFKEIPRVSQARSAVELSCKHERVIPSYILNHRTKIFKRIILLFKDFLLFKDYLQFKVKVNSDPTPSVLTMVMFSSWDWIISLTIARPRPVPLLSFPLEISDL